MHVVLLRFGPHRDTAATHLPGHQAWIDRGIADGVFLVVGSLDDGQGGAVLVTGLSRAETEERVAADPFVAHGVVAPEILTIQAHHLDARLAIA